MASAAASPAPTAASTSAWRFLRLAPASAIDRVASKTTRPASCPCEKVTAGSYSAAAQEVRHAQTDVPKKALANSIAYPVGRWLQPAGSGATGAHWPEVDGPVRR